MTKTPAKLHPSILVLRSPNGENRYQDLNTGRVWESYATVWHLSASRYNEDAHRPTKAYRSRRDDVLATL